MYLIHPPHILPSVWPKVLHRELPRVWSKVWLSVLLLLSLNVDNTVAAQTSMSQASAMPQSLIGTWTNSQPSQQLIACFFSDNTYLFIQLGHTEDNYQRHIGSLEWGSVETTAFYQQKHSPSHITGKLIFKPAFYAAGLSAIASRRFNATTSAHTPTSSNDAPVNLPHNLPVNVPVNVPIAHPKLPELQLTQYLIASSMIVSKHNQTSTTADEHPQLMLSQWPVLEVATVNAATNTTVYTTTNTTASTSTMTLTKVAPENLHIAPWGVKPSQDYGLSLSLLDHPFIAFEIDFEQGSYLRWAQNRFYFATSPSH